MPKKGYLPGLYKAIPLNPNMSRAAKTKALRTIETKARKSRIRLQTHRQHSRRSRSTSGGQGFEGLREASVAGAKLASQPLATAVESYHVVNGVRKMYVAAKRWWDRHA